MKYNILFGMLIVLALLATACGATVPSLPTEIQPLATSVVGTASPLVGEALKTASPAIGEALGTLASPAVVNTRPAGTTVSTAQIPVTGGTRIEEEVTDTYGPVLVDDENTRLYLYKNDTQNGGTSACTDAECAAEWPPVITAGMPVAGPGVDQDMLGTITREDGTVQVTYNGWPLYYSTAGVTDSNGAEGVWFLVTTAGEAASQ